MIRPVTNGGIVMVGECVSDGSIEEMESLLASRAVEEGGAVRPPI